MPTRSPKFLVIRAGAIGDTLMVTPLIRSLRRSFPESYIGMLVSEKAVDVVRYNPRIDEYFALGNRRMPYALNREKQALVRRIKDLQLDTVFSLESDPRFTDLGKRFGASRLITYDPGVHPGVTNLEVSPKRHSSESAVSAGELIGAGYAGLDPEMHYPPELDQHIAAVLLAEGIGPEERLVGIHAGWGSRKIDPDETRLRSWPADSFAKLIRSLDREFNAKVVLTGTPADRPLNEVIATRSGVKSFNSAGRFSLLESAALIKRLSLYVSIDSGPAHLAAAVGIPLITLWGPGIMEQTRPIGGRSSVMVVHSLPPCAPCYGTPLMRSCRDNICMKQIAVEQVLNEVETILSLNHRG